MTERTRRTLTSGAIDALLMLLAVLVGIALIGVGSSRAAECPGPFSFDDVLAGPPAANKPAVQVDADDLAMILASAGFTPAEAEQVDRALLVMNTTGDTLLLGVEIAGCLSAPIPVMGLAPGVQS